MTIPEIWHSAIEFWFGNHYRLDEYVIRDGKRHAFALICPGGGYMMVSDAPEGRAYALELNKRGYSAFVLHYRCRRKARYPAPQQDVAKALHDILQRADELRLDVTNYSLWGSSAGGHMVASFGTVDMGYAQYDLPKPGALILSYPVITMGALTHKWSRNNLLGARPTQEQIELTSVERHITADYPPTYVWCGDADTVVDPQNSRMLVQALASQNVPCEYREFHGVEHGVGLGTGLACEPWFDEAVAFWEKQRNGRKH